MNSKYLIAGGIVIVILAGAYLFIEPTAKTINPDTSGTITNDTNDSKGQPDNITNEVASRYQEYSPEKAASQSQKVVLFFHASWCPTCKAANQEFLNNPEAIPEDVLVLKTDYDTSKELKRKYDVNYQHTFVQIDSQGNQIQQWNGGDIEELIKRVQ